MLILQPSTFSWEGRWTRQGKRWVGWHKAALLLSSKTGLLRAPPSLPALPARHCTTPRVSQSFPATRPPPQDKETEVGGRQRQHGWDSPGGCAGLQSGSGSLLAAALAGFSQQQPVAAPDLLLLLLLPLKSCSGPVTTNPKRHSSLLTRSCSQFTIYPQTGAAREAWQPNRKTVGLAKRETSAQDGRVFSTGF